MRDGWIYIINRCGDVQLLCEIAVTWPGSVIFMSMSLPLNALHEAQKSVLKAWHIYSEQLEGSM
jgi:galactose-1-phosphate uridylyltransferase